MYICWVSTPPASPSLCLNPRKKRMDNKPHQTAAMDDAPLFFRCPISMEIMQDPVTVSTGVTYERMNIEKWLFTYRKRTCPATMQRLDALDLTPNHTLRRLIASWRELAPRSQSSAPSSSAPPTPPRPSCDRGLLASLLAAVDSAPFKVGTLRKLRAEVAVDEEAQLELVSSGGVEVLGRVVLQILEESTDFAAFRACEEALGVLYLLPLSDSASVQLMSTPECVRAMTVMLERGSAEARLHAVTILQRVAGAGGDDFWTRVLGDGDMEFFKSLLELLSDEAATKAGACALDVLLDVMGPSKKSRLKAVELGAARLLVELLPEANRHRCERMLLLLKLLCECPEGRSAFAEHGLGVAAVSKKILRVSDQATKLGVTVLWLVCSFLPTEKVLDDMMVFGAVKKLLALLHIDGRSSTKEKAMKIIKQHGGVWRQYPCFPCELKDYLRLMHASH